VKQILLLSLAGERLGLEVNCVRELAVFEGLTRVPAVPRLFAGLIVVRGELVAAVDLALLWRERPTDLNTITRLAVLGAQRPEFALLAETAEELRIIDEQQLEPTPGRFHGCSFIRGTTGDGLIVLDGNALLEDKRIYA
jgi:purine-binding chemotaxis protein CheW